MREVRARPGFEPGTSRTRSENHTPRPTGQTEALAAAQHPHRPASLSLFAFADPYGRHTKFGPTGMHFLCETQGCHAPVLRTHLRREGTRKEAILSGPARTLARLTKITHPRYLHLRYSQGSAAPKCNGTASPWG